MTIGISKEFLENKRKQLRREDLTLKNSFELALIIELITECTELDPWMKIEDAPLHKSIMTIDKYGYKQIVKFSLKSDRNNFTHYKLLPENPEEE